MHSDKEEGKIRERYYEGVRFLFESSPTSRVGVIDPIVLLSHVAIMIVYLKMAKTIVYCIALYLLGNVSRNYRRAANERLNVIEAACRGLP